MSARNVRAAARSAKRRRFSIVRARAALAVALGRDEVRFSIALFPFLEHAVSDGARA
jgi:hypothetical protein